MSVGRIFSLLVPEKIAICVSIDLACMYEQRRVGSV